MRWILVIVVSLLLSTNAVGQDGNPQDEVEKLRNDFIYLLNIANLKRYSPPPNELAYLLIKFLRLQEVQKRQGNYEQCELIDYVYMQPLVEALKNDAACRIHVKASDSQRAKLTSAALMRFVVPSSQYEKTHSQNLGKTNRSVGDMISSVPDRCLRK